MGCSLANAWSSTTPARSVSPCGAEQRDHPRVSNPRAKLGKGHARLHCLYRPCGNATHLCCSIRPKLRREFWRFVGRNVLRRGLIRRSVVRSGEFGIRHNRLAERHSLDHRAAAGRQSSPDAAARRARVGGEHGRVGRWRRRRVRRQSGRCRRTRAVRRSNRPCSPNWCGERARYGRWGATHATAGAAHAKERADQPNGDAEHLHRLRRASRQPEPEGNAAGRRRTGAPFPVKFKGCERGP
jgi:hypothetical protein